MSEWSVELCRGWEKIGQLNMGDAWQFNGVTRHLERGEWLLTFPDGTGSFSSDKVPDLPNFLDWSNGFVAADDSAQLSVTGDIDVCWFGSLDDWSSGAAQTLFNKWDGFSSGKSWLLWVTATGLAQVIVSADGSAEAGSAGAAVPFTDGQCGGIRFTRVAATGVTTIYFSTDGMTWESAGSSVLLAGSSLFDSSAGVVLGGHSGVNASPPTGRTVWAEMWNGIEGSGGTVVASPDFSDLIPGQHLFFQPLIDQQGNVWNGFGSNVRVGTDSVFVGLTPRAVDTIRLVENGVYRYWGYCVESTAGQGGVRRVVDDQGTHWELSGPDLWWIFADGDGRGRVAYPDPAQPDPSSWSVSHDERTGVASTVLAGYLNDNMGSAALTERQSGFNALDRVAGNEIDWAARLNPLDELVQAVCEEGEITCHLSESAGTVLAELVAPRDLSASRVFSEKARSFRRLDVRTVPARATFVIAGGDGEGIGRTFRTADDGSEGVARREQFYDISSAQTANQVQQAARAQRRLGAATFVVSAELTGEAASDAQFGRSIFVGDKVTVENLYGERFVVPVRSIAWDIGPERQQAFPTLGDAAPDLLRGLSVDVAGLASRFDRNIA